jgi:hypothetical protein
VLAGLEDNGQSLVGMGVGGEFVLKSGAIRGNTRISGEWSNGGGVAVDCGTFVMSGGRISGNSALGETDGAGGGGVKVSNGGTFTMSGGEISGNTTGGKNWSEGAGVKLETGVLTLTPTPGGS